MILKSDDLTLKSQRTLEIRIIHPIMEFNEQGDACKIRGFSALLLLTIHAR